MAEPIKVRRPASHEADLRALCKQIQEPTKEFITIVRRIQKKPSLMDDPLQLGHFANSILTLNEATKIAKGLDA